jgi:hypothetical protein
VQCADRVRVQLAHYQEVQRDMPRSKGPGGVVSGMDAPMLGRIWMSRGAGMAGKERRGGSGTD